jgi:CRISPR/Cas system CMR subunit Cmr6 (Cas7 group RAMP superfamily)
MNNTIQQEILFKEKNTQKQMEKHFYEQILLQKQQDLQQKEFLKINQRQNGAMKMHLDAKKTRLERMKRQDPTDFTIATGTNDITDNLVALQLEKQ